MSFKDGWDELARMKILELEQSNTARLQVGQKVSHL